MSGHNKRIVKNTVMLYFREILLLLVSLYTVRIVLNVLGVEDYGIYNVIGGIVTLFSFLSGTMSSATQRFFSFSLGKNDHEKLKQIFTVNVIIYLGIAIIIFVFLETIGLWFVKESLKIPAQRYESAIFIYHFSVYSFIISIAYIPLIGMIIAHEDMHLYAYISIVEAVLKLCVAFLLIIIPKSKLELYCVLIFLVSIINALIYIVICVRKYEECQFRKLYWDKTVFTEIIGFTGWTLFGQLSTVFRNQAITILLNQVFSPVVVAARAVASNISNQINIFSNRFNTSLYPPIIKSYAANETESMFSKIINGSKITFFLMWVFALPLFLEMDKILRIWLINPPVFAVLFSRLALVEVLINSISLPITAAARAPGKMKAYELTLGSIQIVIFIISWLVLKLGAEAYSVFVIAIIANVVMFFVRLIIVSKLIFLSVELFIKKVVLPVSYVVLLSAITSFGVHFILPNGIIFFGLSILASIMFSTIFMYYLGLDQRWRKKSKVIIINNIRRFIK